MGTITRSFANLITASGPSAVADGSITAADLVSGVAGVNTPSFRATMSAAQTIANNTPTKAQFNTEDFDTGSCYDTSTYRFTPNVAGKYFVGANVRWDTGTDIDIADTMFYKNGSNLFIGNFSNIRYNNWFSGIIVTMNGTTDYIEIYVAQIVGGDLDLRADNNQFFAYKLIGV